MGTSRPRCFGCFAASFCFAALWLQLFAFCLFLRLWMGRARCFWRALFAPSLVDLVALFQVGKRASTASGPAVFQAGNAVAFLFLKDETQRLGANLRGDTFLFSPVDIAQRSGRHVEGCVRVRHETKKKKMSGTELLANAVPGSLSRPSGSP